MNIQLRNLTKVNSELIVKCEKCLDCLKELNGSVALATQISCSICCTRERTMCFLPCGHAGFCEDCAARALRRNRCFTCRAEIESSMRIFL